MRLINVRTRSFGEFVGSHIPKYAILSHTWEDEEVTYRDVIENRHREKKGFAKIVMTCRIAASEGLEWAWVDTCCIDKSSSAELTEAINSMYRWYERSESCYAYLSDLPISGNVEQALPKCRWFTRGWTLQELLAPDNLTFYDQAWNARGDRNQLARCLHQLTGIRYNVLNNHSGLRGIPVAEKMSWAAHRQTTRIEDTAYCLLGIFDVNMPLLYGEEEKAFRRLQKEIIKTTADLSIFTWKLHPKLAPRNDERYLCGVLAGSPAAFWERGLVKWDWRSFSKDFSVTNNGIKIKGQIGVDSNEFGKCYVLFTGCRRNSDKRYLTIRLRKIGSDQFLREDPWTVFTEGPEAGRGRGSCYLLADIARSMKLTTNDNLCSRTKMQYVIPDVRFYVIKIKLLPDLYITQAWPKSNWDEEDNLFFTTGLQNDNYGSLHFNYEFDMGGQLHQLEFMFFIVSWGGRAVQYTIIDYHPQQVTRIKDLTERFALTHYDNSTAVDDLNRHGILRAQYLVYSFPQKNRSLSIKPIVLLQSDANVSHRKFWSVKFNVMEYDHDDVPQAPEELWFEL